MKRTIYQMLRSTTSFGLLAAISLLTIQCDNDEETIVNAAASMVVENASWSYTFEYDESWTEFDEVWKISGTESINGKTYHKLFMQRDELDGPGMDFVRNSENSHMLDIRQEGGRVYAVKSMYTDFVKRFYDIDNPYLAPSGNDDEILLYDFTLGKGDAYPCKDGATVVSVSYTTTRDNVERRTLTLSNDAVIIEGIGCLNSVGSLVAYQNTALSIPGTNDMSQFNHIATLINYFKGRDLVYYLDRINE